MIHFLDSWYFMWVILPLLIFVARIGDMTLDTLRIIMIGHGRKFTASVCGFVEVSIWLLVARQVIVHLPNPMCFLAYAAGFAAGNYVGLLIEERMAVGFQEVRVVITPDQLALTAALKARGFGMTVVDGRGAVGPVHMISTIVPRAAVPETLQLIQKHSPKAFFSVEDVRQVRQGVFPPVKRSQLIKLFGSDRNV